MAKQKQSITNRKKEEPLLFSKTNYLLMILGVILNFSGLFIMTLETAKYGFGFLGLTLGPIVLFSGFIVQFFTIFYRKKEGGQEENNEK